MSERRPAIQGLTIEDIAALENARHNDPEWGAVENIRLMDSHQTVIDFDYHRPCGQLLLKGNRTIHRETCAVLNWPIQSYRMHVDDHQGQPHQLQEVRARTRAEAVAITNDILTRDKKELILWDGHRNVWTYFGAPVVFSPTESIS